MSSDGAAAWVANQYDNAVSEIQITSDLFSTLTGATSAKVGASLTYHAVLSNLGADATVATYTIQATEPVRLNSYVLYASGTCTPGTGGSLTCRLTLEPGASVNLTYRIGVPPGSSEMLVYGKLTPRDVDPNLSNNTGTVDVAIAPVPNTFYEPIVGSGFTDGTINLAAPGRVVFWDNETPNAVQVADETGLNLFHYYLKPQVDFNQFAFWAAGTYTVGDPNDDNLTQTVAVKMSRSPGTGTSSTTFQLRWGAYPAPTGYAYDVEIQRPGSSGVWGDFPSGGAGSGAFVPDAGPGTYRFRARLLKAGTTTGSDWSPVAAIKVTS
ncbi:MAG TPA: hypothetical protein VE824_06190 [Gaiellales bacterium]|nr:hypothetical protein [Gaiellales bacterium]